MEKKQRKSQFGVREKFFQSCDVCVGITLCHLINPLPPGEAF